MCYKTRKRLCSNLTNTFFNSTIRQLIKNDHYHEPLASFFAAYRMPWQHNEHTSRSTESVWCDSGAAGGRHSSPWESGFQRQRNRRKRDGESVIRVIYWPVLLGEARGSDWLALTHSALAVYHHHQQHCRRRHRNHSHFLTSPVRPSNTHIVSRRSRGWGRGGGKVAADNVWFFMIQETPYKFERSPSAYLT